MLYIIKSNIFPLLHTVVARYGGTEVSCVCFYLSRAHELVIRAHELLIRVHKLLSRAHEINENIRMSPRCHSSSLCSVMLILIAYNCSIFNKATRSRYTYTHTCIRVYINVLDLVIVIDTTMRFHSNV